MVREYINTVRRTYQMIVCTLTDVISRAVQIWSMITGGWLSTLWDLTVQEEHSHGFIWPYVTCCITIVLHPVTYRVNALILYFHCGYSIVSLTTLSDLLSTCDKSCSNDNLWSMITSLPLTWVLFWVSAWPIWFIFASTFGQVMNNFSFNWP